MVAHHHLICHVTISYWSKFFYTSHNSQIVLCSIASLQGCVQRCLLHCHVSLSLMSGTVVLPIDSTRRNRLHRWPCCHKVSTALGRYADLNIASVVHCYSGAYERVLCMLWWVITIKIHAVGLNLCVFSLCPDGFTAELYSCKLRPGFHFLRLYYSHSEEDELQIYLLDRSPVFICWEEVRRVGVLILGAV